MVSPAAAMKPSASSTWLASSRIPITLFTVLCKIKIPLIHPLHSSIPTSCKSPQKIKSCSRLTVCSNQSLRVGCPRFQIECITVHIVPSVTRKLHTILLFKRVRSRLRKLTRHSSHLP
ncbi:hypothetical protein Hanom_Chr07g00615441 [Helianthus anomalus]